MGSGKKRYKKRLEEKERAYWLLWGEKRAEERAEALIKKWAGKRIPGVDLPKRKPTSIRVQEKHHTPEEKRKLRAERKSARVSKNAYRIQSEFFFKSEAWQKLRYRALLKYGRKCLCCGAEPPRVILHVDHVKPRSKYPELALEIGNLQILCEDCNKGKGAQYENDFRPKG